ncbi:PDGLE domain-containing protein [Plantactinospora soyae]|uniref:Cobalt/nickel transport protein n=1 Tax=Plantactinospora soyae TaxID=1544732 RepID=A0A927M8V4_9ACTN|nr:PDGLE domain-containing protein [Plantactinospora soyae]MBE1487478.1 cobalt/nickel transport protein [Plantactinospora soyae]
MTKRTGAFILGGLLVALLLAGVVSNFASAHPDGLDSSLRQGCTFDADDNITGGSCPAQQSRDHELADSPLADYGVRGIDNSYLSTGLSGVLGVLLTFAIGGGLFWLVRRRSTDGVDAGRVPTDGDAAGSGRVSADGVGAGAGRTSTDVPE